MNLALKQPSSACHFFHVYPLLFSIVCSWKLYLSPHHSPHCVCLQVSGSDMSQWMPQLLPIIMDMLQDSSSLQVGLLNKLDFLHKIHFLFYRHVQIVAPLSIHKASYKT